jgi:hypothetical protein
MNSNTETMHVRCRHCRGNLELERSNFDRKLECPGCAYPVFVPGERVEDGVVFLPEELPGEPPHPAIEWIHERLQDGQLKRAFLKGLIVFLTLAAAIGIGILIFGSFSETEGKILATTGVLAMYSFLGLCCSMTSGKSYAVPLALSGITVTVIGAITMICATWDVFSVIHNIRWITVPLVLSGTAAHLSLMMLIEPVNETVTLIRRATLGAIGIVTLITLIMIYGETAEEILVRALGVFAILDVLGTMATPVLNRVWRVKA